MNNPIFKTAITLVSTAEFGVNELVAIDHYSDGWWRVTATEKKTELNAVVVLPAQHLTSFCIHNLDTAKP